LADQDYGTVVQGGLKTWTVVLTDSAGWAVGSDSWTWKMLVGRDSAPTTAVVTITSTSSVITTVTDTSDTMTLVFNLTRLNSDLLTPGRYLVEIEGLSGTDERYYDEAHGAFLSRTPEGGG